ncbi:MAG: GIY-YIG nuclease family protein [Verrucomicrobiia bacterium]
MTKQHILDEIKRTAAANGGVALGMGRFYKTTGIKQTDWYGKYWARWGDAVAECGLSQNQMQGAYNRDMLLEKLVGLVREKGQFPTHGEIKLKSHTKKGFPAGTTFDNHFPTKTHMVSAVLEYCRQRDGYDDVIKICEAVVSRKKQPKEDTAEVGQIGFVYLFKSGRFYKIGRSNSAGRREYELSVQMPEKAEMVHEMRTDDPVGIEKYWHERFAARRKNGEWFDLSAADVNAFKRRKFM